jgi:hypothetical protein
MAHLVSTTATVLIVVLLLSSSVSKALNFDWFVGVVKKHRLLPARWSRLIGLLIVAAEFSAGSLFAFSRTRVAAGAVALALFTVFSMATVINMLRGRRQLECGCSGLSKNAKIGWSTVARNGGLIVITLCGMFQSAYATNALPLSIILVGLTLAPSPAAKHRNSHGQGCHASARA